MTLEVSKCLLDLHALLVDGDDNTRRIGERSDEQQRLASGGLAFERNAILA